MRSLIVTNIISVDGCYEGPGHDVMALPMDHFFDAYCAERLEHADTLVLGRTTYQLLQDFWPEVVNDQGASPAERQISRLNNAIDKVVVSDSLQPDTTTPWADTTRILARADATERIRELKAGPGRDLLVFGSRTLWNELLAAGLVDELHLLVGPVVVGDGTPLFGRRPSAPLRLLGTRSVDDSGNVLVRYATTAHDG